ncbi:MAG: transporter substrate-binding domain-containing protein [Paucibacter sp.]|nr:transporter substrate-binding domain-containing protein [Roseateles sp.]
MPRPSLRTLAAALLLALAGAAQAQCTRALKVPVAPIGLAVTVVDGQVGGIYPELLRAEAARVGCTIDFQVVPRARQEMLFATGQADLLMPARRSARRDAEGIFVLMIRSRAELMWLEPRQLPVHSVAELLQHDELRVGVVRGYDYDASYQTLMQQLAARKRLTEATDPSSLARMLDAGIVDLAVVTPLAVTGALRSDAKLRPLIERLHTEPAEELGWGESGAYVSPSAALSEADRQLALQMLEHIGRSGAAWHAFQRYYPDSNLSESVRPR